MMNLIGVALVTFLVGVTWAGTTEEEGKKFIEEVNKKKQLMVQDAIVKKWAADTADKAHLEKATKEFDEADKKVTEYDKEVYSKLMTFPWRTFKDPKTKYMFTDVFYSSPIALPDDKKAKFRKLNQDVNKVSETALLKEYKSADNKPKLTPSDVSIIACNNYTNVEEMNFYWKEYYDTLGKPVKNPFMERVPLLNEDAHINKYSNAAESSHSIYEVNDFENTMHELYTQIEPLYKELHAYIRYKLWVATGKKDNIVDPKGPIPASLLGSSWGGDVSSMYDLLVPYPQKEIAMDFSPQMKAKGYSSKKMAQIAEHFYVSLGLSKMPEDFWAHSVFEQKGHASCSPNAYDFSNGKDYRLVFCAELHPNDFATMHEYLGDIEYFIESKNQPYLFQGQVNGAINLAFHNVIDGYAYSPDYLKSLGLLNSNFKVDKELVLNVLLIKALSEFVFIPWAYSMNLWLWDVYKGKITPQKYNCEYWKMRTNLEGVEPPVDRDENDFDVGVYSNFITGGGYSVDYISKFLTYDMARGLCKAAGYYDPKTKPNNYLVFCDIHNSKAAGAKLKEMMALGSSQPWYELLSKITGKKKMDASALLEYYHPLYDWLKEENKKNKVTVGWNAGHNRCH